MESAQSAAPQIALNQISVGAQEGKGNWKILWRVANVNSQPLELCAVRLPHGQFKAAKQRFRPALTLAPKQATRFDAVVRCDEPAGLVTKNAFLIFQAVRFGERWRILARVRVIVNSRGEPATKTELITSQKVGFSAELS